MRLRALNIQSLIESAQQVTDRINAVSKRYPGLPEAVVNALVDADPTPEKKYLAWLAKQTVAKHLRMPEDALVIGEDLKKFSQMKQHGVLRGAEGDIMRYETPGKLRAKMGSQEKSSDGHDVSAIWPDGAEELSGNGLYRILRIGRPHNDGSFTTEDAVNALAQFAAKTGWCVKNKATARNYLADGPFYLIAKNKKPYCLIHPASSQAKDVHDEPWKPATPEEGEAVDRLVHGFIPRSELGFFRDDMEVFLPGPEHHSPAKDGFHSRRHAAVYVRKSLREKVPDGILQATLQAHRGGLFLSDDDAKDVVDYAIRHKARLPDDVEKAVFKRPNDAVRYIFEVIHKRVPEAEPQIMKNIYAAIDYAKKVVRGRWPEFEKHLLSVDNAGGVLNTVNYAIEVVKKRWPEAEPFILKHMPFNDDDYRMAARKYACEIVKEPWPEYEDLLLPRVTTSNDLRDLVYYVNLVRGGEWPRALTMLTQRVKSSAYSRPSFPVDPLFMLVRYMVLTNLKGANKPVEVALSIALKEADSRSLTQINVALRCIADYIENVRESPWPKMDEAVMDKAANFNGYDSYVKHRFFVQPKRTPRK